MEKLKQTLLNFIGKFKISKKDCVSMSLLKGHAVLFLLCILLYIVMTLFDWYRLGYPDKEEFRQFLIVLGGFSTILSFYGKWLVDADKNGIPDEAEKKDEVKTEYGTRKIYK